MTLKEFRRVNIDSHIMITVLSEQTDWLDCVEVDYTRDINIDYMLDLYALGAIVHCVNVNHALNVLNITVIVNTSRPLYRWSMIAERSGERK